MLSVVSTEPSRAEARRVRGEQDDAESRRERHHESDIIYSRRVEKQYPGTGDEKRGDPVLSPPEKERRLCDNTHYSRSQRRIRTSGKDQEQHYEDRRYDDPRPSRYSEFQQNSAEYSADYSQMQTAQRQKVRRADTREVSSHDRRLVPDPEQQRAGEPRALSRSR